MSTPSAKENSLTTRAAEGIYRGVWAGLRRWFRVPQDAPSLPIHAGGHVEALRPAPGFLRYLKLQFWILLALIDVLLIGAWIVILIASPTIGLIIAIPVWILVIAPDICAYVAIHLRYDTTWYVLSDRSMRIRSGVWTLSEATITYENVQNVSVSQGPVQRWFGIANVVVVTAGGGSQGPHGTTSAGHTGLLEGIANAAGVRDLIMDRVRASRHAGLGDERHDHAERGNQWSAAHIEVLAEIRDAIKARPTS